VNTPLMNRRRWLLVAGVVVALLALGAAWGRFIWLPGYRPALFEGETYGIDVSAHQGRIDWKRVAEDGISFAYIKATEGGDHVDDRFVENWTNAATSGLRRGAYHFFTLCTPGASQAQLFLRVLPRDPGALPPALDLELAGNCSARPTSSDVTREVTSYVNLVEEATGRQVLLYIGDDFESAYALRAILSRPLWVRRILRRPADPRWIVWQVGGFSRIAGIRGRVDLDVGRPELDQAD
jgi:lysozyme